MTEAIESPADVTANLAAIKARIHDAERAAGRPEGAVTLVAVTKNS